MARLRHPRDCLEQTAKAAGGARIALADARLNRVLLHGRRETLNQASVVMSRVEGSPWILPVGSPAAIPAGGSLGLRRRRNPQAAGQRLMWAATGIRQGWLMQHRQPPSGFWRTAISRRSAPLKVRQMAAA